MNSDLNTTDDVLSTDNPQGAASPAGASSSSDFQQAAGMEVLNQTRSLTVADNGQPITVSAKPAATSTSAGMYGVIIIGTILFLVLCARLIQWVKAAPSKQATAVLEPAVMATPKPAAKNAAQKGKKKQPRSKRRR